MALPDNDGTEDVYADLPEGASPNWTIMDELGLDDGTVEQGCCVDECDDSCGGYGRMLKADVERRVAFIGQPGAGKSARAGCCGERVCDGTLEEDIFEMPGFVGMIHSGKTDLARRAKGIARGRPVEDESYRGRP